jgi:hypothetical protein
MENNKDETKNDSLIRDFAESLQKAKIPEGLRESNRKYIKDALYSTEQKGRATMGWWKRRISIPVPIAAGFMLLICLQVTLQFTSFNANTNKTTSVVSDKTQNSIGLSEKPLESHHSEHSVYVAGMGFTKRSINYEYFLGE